MHLPWLVSLLSSLFLSRIFASGFEYFSCVLSGIVATVESVATMGPSFPVLVAFTLSDAIRGFVHSPRTFMRNCRHQ